MADEERGGLPPRVAPVTRAILPAILPSGCSSVMLAYLTGANVRQRSPVVPIVKLSLTIIDYLLSQIGDGTSLLFRLG